MATANLIWKQDRIVVRVRAVMLRRAQFAAETLEREVRARVGDPYPPASAPGQPPHRRTGALQRSIQGFVKPLAMKIRVGLSIAAPYAKFLQRGTTRMAARPFLGTVSDRRRVVDILSGRSAR